MKSHEEKDNLTDDLLKRWVFNKALDKLSANIYVTDAVTDQILFMNSRMKKAFQLEKPEGQVCWKVLKQNSDHKCDSCPEYHLDVSDPENDSCMWEEESSRDGRLYENFSCLMNWPDDRILHFHYSTDITEMKTLHLQASTDELTGIFNRRAGKEALECSLETARRSGVDLTIAMIDVNELKKVNDEKGHQAGDKHLVAIVNEIKTNLSDGEYLFRLGGDEFVCVFTNTSPSQAADKLKSVLNVLKTNEFVGNQEQDAFCFGLITVDGNWQCTVDDAINAADEKLYQYKRALHIDRANRRLQRGGSEKVGLQNFSYNKELLYDALSQSTDDYIYLCNMKTGVFRYPQSMVEEFELPGQIVHNAAAVWAEKIHEHDKAAFLESNQEIIDGRSNFHSVEYRAKNHEGQWTWLRCRGYLERDENGEPELFAGITTNLGSKNRVDHMTGLFNRFEFVHQLEILTGEDKNNPLILMHLGLDDLKRINDLYDRHFGDEVIRIAAQRLQTMLPDNGMLFRLDGDEFAIVLFGSDRNLAEKLYHTIQQAFNHKQSYENKNYNCTMSCGCVAWPEYQASYMELIKYAGYALNHAKQIGKNRLVFFSRELLVEKTRTLGIEEKLRESMDHGFKGFEVYFQPVFSPDRKMIGAECLSRWACDKFGQVGPGEFIPLLEKNGLILKLGRWVFEQAARLAAKWEQENRPLKVSVNVSGTQMADEGLLDFMKETIDKYHANPKLIMLELTESYFVDNVDGLFTFLSQCREIGMSIAIDDFGTGYSSLGLLEYAPADVVKIDRAFITGIQNSEFHQTFVRLIAELCHVMEMEVCVEGVEVEDEMQTVEQMDIQYIQGFYLGRPMTISNFEERF